MYILLIKKMRKQKNISQNQLAHKINVSRSYLCELEKNKYDIKLSILIRIANKLDVCPCELFECNTEKCTKKYCNVLKY